MTARQIYWDNLRTTRNATGTLDRHLNFAEAEDLVYGIDCMYQEGFDLETAAQRAYDCIFSARIARRNGMVWSF